MSTVLGLDIGSSSVIAGILRGRKVEREAPRAFFRSRCTGPNVELDPEELLRAVRTAIAGLEGAAAQVDAIHLAVMSPASALTPELTPKASASGSATMPTVRPASRSDRQLRRTPL